MVQLESGRVKEEKVVTDKELLELAALAAGIDVGWYSMINGARSPIIEPKNQRERNWLGHEYTEWNPLLDDGDALRLAVKLELRVSTHCNQQAAYASDIYGRSDVSLDPVPWDNDPYAATRRAIVRAAAEIGQHMKGV